MATNETHGRPEAAALLGGLLALAAVFVSGCRERGTASGQVPAGVGPAVPVMVATAVAEDVPVRLKEVARVETYNTVTVRSRVEGQVTEVHVADGADVKTGDLLFVIDPRPFEAAVHLAEANLARDKALAADDKKKAEQFDEGFRQHTVSERDRDAAAAAYDAAVATVHADEAALENARLQLEYCMIRSPIDGKVGERLTDLGNMVMPNVTPLVLVNQIKPIYVTFSVPELNLGAIQTQRAAGPLTVEAAIPGDTNPPKRGVLTFVDNQVDSATGTIRLIGTFANEDRRLWPGQFVKATLTVAIQKNVVVVPSQAIQATQAGDIIYVVRQNQTVDARPVVTGEILEGRTIIREGIEPGEVVVTEGQLRLVPGARVEIVEPATRPASRASSTVPS